MKVKTFFFFAVIFSALIVKISSCNAQTTTIAIDDLKVPTAKVNTIVNAFADAYNYNATRLDSTETKAQFARRMLFTEMKNRVVYITREYEKKQLIESNPPSVNPADITK